MFQLLKDNNTHYMTPEVIKHHTSKLSEIWSLGCTVYETLISFQNIPEAFKKNRQTL
jgi:serine/threonine protein kinase